MKLSLRISVLLLIQALLIGFSISYPLDKLMGNALWESEDAWVETLIDSIREPLSKDVINNNPLHVSELLHNLVDRQPVVQYAYIVGFDSQIFAHTFHSGIPRAFVEMDHMKHSSGITKKMYHDENIGTIHDVRIPLIEGTRAGFHLGISGTAINSLITQTRLLLIAVVVSVTIVVIIFVSPFSVKVSRPLAQLAKIAKFYGKGEKVEFSSIKSNTPEVDTLVSAFQQMITDRDSVMASLVERENYLALTLNSIGDAVIATDADSRIVRMNPVAEQLTGWRFRNACGKKTSEVFNIVHAGSKTTAEDPVQKALHTGKIVGLADHTVLISKNGSEYQIADSGAPIVDSKGTVLGVILVFRDTTEEYRLHQELLKSKQNLEIEVRKRTKDLEKSNIALKVANHDLESFSYSVSHDLRSPLRSINGFSQVLIEDYANQLDECAKNYLQRVQIATIRMGRLIEDMLSLSRVNRQPMTRNKVDISELVAQIYAALQESEPERQVKFSCKPGIRANGDVQLLSILFTNLIGNAWKYSANNPNAKIEVGTTEKDGETCYFVSDNGVGFDMKYSNKLFNEFQRLHPSSDFEGSGIGLATVKRIVDRHYGEIWANSEPNKGSTFYMTLYNKSKITTEFDREETTIADG